MPTFNDHLLPQTTGTYDIGSSTQRWRAAFLDKIDLAGFMNEICVLGPDYLPNTDLGTKITQAIASLPSGGGTIDCRGFTGTQTISSTITINKPVRLILGAYDITCSATAFQLDDDLWIEGMRGYTTLTSASSAKIFNGGTTANCKFFRCEGMTLVGGGGTAQCFETPASFGDPNTPFAKGQYQFINNVIKDFSGEYAIKLGASTYFVTICFNTFQNNAGDIKFDQYSELFVYSNQFWYAAAGSDPKIHGVGSSITNIWANDFEGASSSTGPDILITPTNRPEGHLWIHQNKFGPEGESATRRKIVVNGSATLPALNLRIEDNNFSGPVALGEVCIELLSPLGHSSISGNFFSNYTTVVRDAQPLLNNPANNDNVFRGNRFFSESSRPPILFTNKGRGFSVIEDPFGSVDAARQWHPVNDEAPKLRNRLHNSENLLDTAHWTAPLDSNNQGIQVTISPTGPFDGSAAFILTRPPVEGGSYNIRASIDRSGGMPEQVVVSFWAKAETGSDVMMSISDNTTQQLHEHKTFRLTNTWERYVHTFAGLPDADARLMIYPCHAGGSGDSIAISSVQVSDYDTPYLPTTGSAAYTETYGTRRVKAADFAGGLRIGDGTLVKQLAVHPLSLSPTAIAANSTDEQIFTVTGLTNSDVVLSVSKAAHQPGLGIVGWRVTTSGELAITFMNISAGSITPGASYEVVTLRT